MAGSPAGNTTQGEVKSEKKLGFILKLLKNFSAQHSGVLHKLPLAIYWL